MHEEDPKLSVVRVGHRVPLAGLCLSLYSLHMLNRDVNMIQTNKPEIDTMKGLASCIFLAHLIGISVIKRCKNMFVLDSVNMLLYFKLP